MSDYNLIVEAGEFTYGGFDVTFTAGVGYALTADFTPFALTGFDSDGITTELAVAGTIEMPPATTVVVEDIPALNEHQQDKIGLTVGATTTSPDDEFVGATLFESVDAGVTYTPLEKINGQAIIGNVIGTCGGGVSARFWDTTTTIRVRFHKNDSEQSSELDEIVAAGKVNTILVGNELISFATATLISSLPLIYDLSRLLRGRRNTESHIDRHAEGERVMLLTAPSSVRFVETGPMDYGVEKVLKIVPNGLTVDDVDEVVRIRPAGESMKQFQPEIRPAVRDATGTVTIRWIGRSKSRFRLLSGIIPRLWDCGCCPRYRLVIWNGARTAIIRTICLEGDEEFVYTAALQVIDFGSTQSTLEIDIYQMGFTVGRGRLLEATV